MGQNKQPQKWLSFHDFAEWHPTTGDGLVYPNVLRIDVVALEAFGAEHDQALVVVVHGLQCLDCFVGGQIAACIGQAFKEPIGVSVRQNSVFIWLHIVEALLEAVFPVFDFWRIGARLPNAHAIKALYSLFAQLKHDAGAPWVAGQNLHIFPAQFF